MTGKGGSQRVPHPASTASSPIPTGTSRAANLDLRAEPEDVFFSSWVTLATYSKPRVSSVMLSQCQVWKPEDVLSNLSSATHRASGKVTPFGLWLCHVSIMRYMCVCYIHVILKYVSRASPGPKDVAKVYDTGHCQKHCGCLEPLAEQAAHQAGSGELEILLSNLV